MSESFWDIKRIYFKKRVVINCIPEGSIEKVDNYPKLCAGENVSARSASEADHRDAEAWRGAGQGGQRS